MPKRRPGKDSSFVRSFNVDLSIIPLPNPLPAKVYCITIQISFAGEGADRGKIRALNTK